ncbi:probable serine/threonine-protein kinase kinX isoform X1 [Amphiprion ocellaris]|uniref:probable serine/threonine-protein kinase kinX isoform X1 n=1 Tax=Amphiprion ocellaris TaxID=80972 RepID=UPI000C311F44|nr:probable serine/threonine-protein kinase kinX isoform X1 [Amphiprion ocellaris]
MKRRRTWARPLPLDDDDENDDENDNNDEEEEEEESTSDRRDSLRKRKKVNYWTDAHVDGEDEEDEYEEDEEEGEEEGEHSQTTPENSEPCIEYQGDFCTPPEFEDIAGKSRAKKWKTSIFYKRKPLQYYFDKELLTTVGYHRRRRETAKQTTPSGRESPCSVASEEESTGSKNDCENMVILIEDSEDERFGTENDTKVRDPDKRKDEEVKNGEMKDEEVTVAADFHVDNDATEECIQLIATEFYKQVAKKTQVKVALERIQLVVGPAAESDSCTPLQARSDDQTSSTELPEEAERLCEDEDAHSDKEDEHNSPAAADLYDSPAAHAYSPQTSDPLIIADVSGPSTSPPNVQTEDPGEPDVPSSGLNTAQSHGIKLETSSPQTSKASDYIQEPSLNAGPYILETSTIKTSDYSPVKPSLNAGPYIQEEPTNHLPSGPPSDEDTIDVDQLKREKLKMQLKVLKLQEEYYTLKILKLKE